MKDFEITPGKRHNTLSYQDKEIVILRTIAGVAFAEEQHHGMVVLAEDEHRDIWIVNEFTSTRRDEFFRYISMVAKKYVVEEGYHQPDRWAISLAQAYTTWATENRPDFEMALFPDPDGILEDDSPRLLSVLETGIEKTRRKINPLCRGLSSDLKLLGQPREQLKRTFRQHPLLHALSLGLSGLDFYNPPKPKDAHPPKRKLMLHEQILVRAGRICFE